MSNVLIGIIGVILFIGLALAGALFLGPRFQEASNNSKASAYVASLKQTADAMSMYLTNTGSSSLTDTQPNNSDTTFLVSNGYLKSKPPGTSTDSVMVYNWAGTISHIAFLYLNETPANQQICQSIQRQSGQPIDLNANGFATPTTPAVTTGCIRNGTDSSARLLIFQRF